MIIAFIGLGSNLNNPSLQIHTAVEQIEKIPQTLLIKRSSDYVTSPVGEKNQSNFINAVVKVKTELSALELLKNLQNIENRMGRIREKKWGPRLIDLDLLLYDDEVINVPELTVPHSEMQKRLFVLIPLQEIEPDLIFPNRASIQDYLRHLSRETDQMAVLHKLF